MTQAPSHSDILVVGGGIAGISAAAYLSRRAHVTVVDMERTLTHHTTGRSAAMYVPNYGSPETRGLTVASHRFFASQAEGYADAPVLTPRGTLTIGRPDQQGALDRWYREAVDCGADVRWVDPATLRRIVPVLRDGYAAAGLHEQDAAELDVAAIHQAFVRMARQHGASILPHHPVRAARRAGTGWDVEAGSQRLGADVIVNAAGAWGDEVAAMAGVPPVGLVPMRRTAFMVAAPPDAHRWPMLIDADQDWYVKPDGEQLLCSPADETPSPPCDARPEEVDVATAIERINTATTMEIRTVRSQWAGLRTFARDRAPVMGFEPDHPGFFWLVGQGGTGIQSSPAAGRLAAGLLLDDAVPPDIAMSGLQLDTFLPNRFR